MTTHNTNAEQGLIASILIDSTDSVLLSAIQARITEAHFEDPSCRAIWNAINEVHQSGDPVDLLTVMRRMIETRTLAEIGGPGRLNQIATSTESTIHAKIWIRDLVESRSVRLIQWNAEILKSAVLEPDSQATVADIIAKLQEAHQNAVEIDDDGDWGKSIASAERRFLDALEGLQSEYEISTPYPSMDHLSGRWQLGELIVVGGVSGGGKTALACNIAIHIATHGRKTAFYSLEMSDVKLIFRMASSLCGIPSKQINTLHKLQSDQFHSQLRELRKLDTLRIFQRKMDARAIESSIRMLHRKWGLEVVFIDYAQLVEPFDNKANREQQVARISRMLKRLTRELNVTIIALAQISKESEKENRKPRASDLRESQSLRHDADRCYFVFKPNQNKSGQPQDTETLVYDVLYYVDKNRDDRTGQAVWLRFDTPCQRLREIDDRSSHEF